MKERPILMSTPMVKALLEGRKTQTRRIVKIPDDYDGSRLSNDNGLGFHYGQQGGAWEHLKCPYGRKGDILWVRETWRKRQFPNDIKEYFYKADIPDYELFKWKPSIFMPKEACRIKLEITDIRVERLQDISEEDAIAEGVSNADTFKGIGVDDNIANRYAYRELWESLNGNKSWDINPWVWIINFKKLNNGKENETE